MYIVFVYFDFMKGAGGKYYEGLASLSACLKQQGHKVCLFHITEKLPLNQFLDAFKSKYSDANVVGFSSTSNVFPYVDEFSIALKKTFPKIVTICGGPQPTLLPKETLESPGLDIICRGEGEFAMLELCQRLESGTDITSIQGLGIKQGQQIYSNPPRSPIQDLDSLPYPDRELFDYERSVDKIMNHLACMGSRGCAYNCTHCCNHAFRELYPNGSAYVRFKSPNRLIAEIKQALLQYPEIKLISFDDDILLLKKNWYSEFLEKYKNEIHKPFTCNTRFELIHNEVLDKLKEAGCHRIHIGLESGNQYIRTEILNRKQTTQMILSTGQIIEQKQMPLSLYNMVGIPYETPAAALDTVKLNARLKACRMQVSIFYPYPATDLYVLCQNKGFLTGKRLDSYFESETILQLPGFPAGKILFAYHHFKIFVSYYRTVFSFKQPWQSFFEKLVDFLWFHPKFYTIINPPYRALKKVYKSIRRVFTKK